MTVEDDDIFVEAFGQKMRCHYSSYHKTYTFRRDFRGNNLIAGLIIVNNCRERMPAEPDRMHTPTLAGLRRWAAYWEECEKVFNIVLEEETSKYKAFLQEVEALCNLTGQAFTAACTHYIFASPSGKVTLAYEFSNPCFIKKTLELGYIEDK